MKPDLVAPGVGLLTADPGKAEDGTPRYSSVSGSSASAAVVAGAAALLAQARPELDASALKGLLAGSARALPRESVAAQGAGLLDLGAASANETAALPTTLSFGRASRDGGLARHAEARPAQPLVSATSHRDRHRPARPRRRARARVRVRAVADPHPRRRRHDGLRRGARARAGRGARSRACSRCARREARRSTSRG